MADNSNHTDSDSAFAGGDFGASERYSCLDKALAVSLDILQEEGKANETVVDRKEAKDDGRAINQPSQADEAKMSPTKESGDILMGQASSIADPNQGTTDRDSRQQGTDFDSSKNLKSLEGGYAVKTVLKPAGSIGLSHPAVPGHRRVSFFDDTIHEDEEFDESRDGFGKVLSARKGSLKPYYSSSSDMMDLSNSSKSRRGSTAPSLSRGRSMTVFFEEGEDGMEVEVIQLEEDIFSLMIVAKTRSRCLWYAFGVFVSQITTLSLILYDILQDPSFGVDKVPFNLPINVDWQVSVAQFIALVIAVVSVDDLRTTLSMVYVGYDPSITTDFPGASRFKFIVASFFRFVQGILVCFTAFVFVMQSDNILDIFMNFAAVEFISNLDNLAFQLMTEGYLGCKCQREAQAVLEIRFPVQRPHLKWLTQLLFYTTIATLLSGWATVFTRQYNGHLLKIATCQGFQIGFGDDSLTLQDGEPVSFQGSFREARNEVFQRFDVSNPPNIIPYQFFAGYYYPLPGNDAGLRRFNRRPVYTQDGVDDPTAGRIYYCENLFAWVFTIPALASALPLQGIKECGSWGWLMKSPLTEVFTLESAPGEEWKGWDGKNLFAAEFSRVCIECLVNSDCDFSHGTCDGGSKMCSCNADRTGHFCAVSIPYCPSVRFFSEGDSAFDYTERTSYDLVYKANGQPLEIHDRPVFQRDVNGTSEVLLSTGRRWFVTEWSDPVERDFILHENFHVYWDGIYWGTDEGRGNVLRISSSSLSFSPADDELSWFQFTEELAFGTSNDYFRTLDPVDEIAVCEEIDCAGRTCGKHGDCVDNSCDCTAMYGGFYCQHAPDGPYASGLYERLQAGDDLSNYTYYQRYWADPSRRAMRDEL